MKKILVILLILVLVTVFAVACGVGIEQPTSEPTTAVDYESEYADEPDETQQDEPEELPTDDIADNNNDNGNVDDNAEPTTISNESSTPVEAVTPNEVNTPQETVTNNVNENVAIVVNGAVLSGVYAHTATGATSPTHVPAAHVAWALGAEVTGAGLDTAIEGLNGTIFFTVGSNEFDVNGETITLQHNTIQHNNVIYVPLSFFSDAFGGSVSVDGNRIYISG